MDITEKVAAGQVTRDMSMLESESSQDCISEAAPKDTKEIAQNESDKEISAVQIDAERYKDCHVTILTGGVVSESVNAVLGGEEIEDSISLEQKGSSEGKAEYVKSNIELAVDSNKESASVSHSETLDFSSKIEAGFNQDKNDGKDESANILYEFLKKQAKQSPPDILKMVISGIDSIDCCREEVVEFPSAINKAVKGIAFPSAIGPRDLVTMHPYRLFSKFEEELDMETENKTANPEDCIQTCTIEEKHSDASTLIEAVSNLRSQEQDSEVRGIQKKIRALEVDAPGFAAKRIEPVVTVEQDKFQISLDVSLFNKESIFCYVGSNRLYVYAWVYGKNDYGVERHEMHQVFEVPQHVDQEKFSAYIRNGLLLVDAPFKPTST